MAERLDDPLVEDALNGLPAWSGDSNGITRVVPVTGPMADDLIASVGETATAMDHHPEVNRDGEGVTFLLTTHSAGGVTVTDIAMASVIEDLVASKTHLDAEHGHHEVMTEAVEVSPKIHTDDVEPMIGQPAGGAGGPATMLPSADPGAPEPGIEPEQESAPTTA
jgi:4a-hydroxytetrahydrobiopterin dehydratase